MGIGELAKKAWYFLRRKKQPQEILLILVGVVIAYLLTVAFLTPEGTLGSASQPAMHSADEDAVSIGSIERLAEANRIESAYWYANQIVFTLDDGTTERIDNVSSEAGKRVATALETHGVDVIIEKPPYVPEEVTTLARLSNAYSEMLWFFTMLVPVMFVLIMVFFISLMVGNGMKKGWPDIRFSNPTRFSDVAGLGAIRDELAEVKEFLDDPKAFIKVGAKAPRGVLMVGPPGTGKTLMARALAGECGAAFISVSGSDFSSQFIGQGSARIRKVFEKARKYAPAIIFIDEIDSVARQRGGMGGIASHERDTILNQLLVEMDGFDQSKRIVVIAATNRVDVLDAALLRPGRFDRHIHVNLPDRKGRLEILKLYAADVPLADDADLESVARGTPGFSGADLANLMNEAAVLVAREKGEIVETRHLMSARDKVVLGVERTHSDTDEADLDVVAVHESGHAVVATALASSDPVHQVTIKARGATLGSVMTLPEKDRLNISRAKLDADLVLAMAGRAAEAEFFGATLVTTGAAGDIAFATDLATKMVCEWGMSTLGMVKIDRRVDGTLPPEAEAEVRRILALAYDEAVALVKAHRGALQALRDLLLAEGTVSGETVRDLVATPALAVAAE